MKCRSPPNDPYCHQTVKILQFIKTTSYIYFIPSGDESRKISLPKPDRYQDCPFICARSRTCVSTFHKYYVNHSRRVVLDCSSTEIKNLEPFWVWMHDRTYVLSHVCYLTTSYQWLTTIRRIKGDKWILNCKGNGRKRRWPVSKVPFQLVPCGYGRCVETRHNFRAGLKNLWHACPEWHARNFLSTRQSVLSAISPTTFVYCEYIWKRRDCI
jgi:hypothetical protein